jgi:copper ion binding protein
MIERVTLSVPDVSCEHCVKTVDTALTSLPGVSTATTDLASKQVTVSYDPDEVSISRIVTTLDEAGYPVPTDSIPEGAK